MPALLSPLAYIEKNALASDGVWAILIEMNVPQLEEVAEADRYIRICSDNEDITWNGKVWQSFPFSMDEIGDHTKGEIPQFAVRISNINHIVQGHIELAHGMVGSIVKIFVINTNIQLKGVAAPEIELEFMVKSTNVDNRWATFILGVTSPYSTLIGKRMLRTGCRYSGLTGTQNGFKGPLCKYRGSQEECDKTLRQCRELGNSVNFGGFPGVGMGNTFYA